MKISALPMEVLLYSEINILSVIVMLIIALNAIRSYVDVAQKTRLFVLSVFAAAAANGFDFFWNMGINDFLKISVSSLSAVNFFYFTSLGISTYCWFMYTEATFNSDRLDRKFCMLSAIPFLTLIVFLIVSRFTGLAFYFDEEGVYHRGVLFYLQHVLGYGYMFGASILCLRRAAAKENYARRDELLAMASFVVPPLICVVAQIWLQNIPILSVGIMISFLLVYIQALENKISTDELTGLSDRRELLRRVSAEIKLLRADDKLYFMFMDIDHFKKTNDECGHAEGDRALKVLSSVLRQVSDETGGFCARYGGDEFAFFVRCGSVKQALLIKQLIEDLAKKRGAEEGLISELGVSVGCAEYKDEAGGIQKLIADADRDMYDEKARKKANVRGK